MSEVTSPKHSPELAAQEVLLALVTAGQVAPISARTHGEDAAEGLIALHQKLTAYYRSLSEAQ